eukprot:1260013-Amphidinium_carterae.2
MDPKPDEISRWVSVGDVVDWAGLSGSVDDDSTPKGSLLKTFGFAGGEHWRGLALATSVEVDAVLAEWKLGGEPPSLAAMLMARSVFHGAWHASGLRRDVSASPAGTNAPVSVTPVGRRFKMASIIDQTMDEDRELLSTESLTEAYKRYKAKMGGAPLPRAEPTAEQVSGIATMAKDGVPPVPDFAIFGPYASRISRKLKFSSLVFDAGGVLKRIELTGPDSFAAWFDCYQVWRCCLIMLDIAEPAAIDAYCEKVRELSCRYGSECWGILYQSEVRCRREHFIRLQRQGQDFHAAGMQVNYEPSRPWNYVLRAASEDMSFWTKEAVEHCIMARTSATPMSELIQGDAPTTGGLLPSWSTKRSAPEQTGATSTKRRTQAQPSGRQHSVGSDGRLTHNRRGRPLCSGYQTGECAVADGDGSCSRDPALKHQCSICLSFSHGAHNCRQEKPKTPSSKGKGKGKGRSA